MAFDVGTLQATITADVRDFKKGVGEVKRETSRVGSAIKTMGKTIAVGMAAVGAAGTAFGVASVKAASDAEETQNRFDAVFSNLSDSANVFADELANSVGRTVTEIRDGMASFQGMAVGLGLAEDEAFNMSTRLQKLAIDFASFNNLTDAEATERFIAAMSGSAEVLDRFGINTKMANLELKLQEMGLAKSAAKATEAQKALARFAIIEETMGEQGAIGDAIKTSDSFANQMRRLQSQFENLKVEVGENLLPIANNFIGMLNDNFTPAVHGLRDFIMDTVHNFQSFYESLQQNESFKLFVANVQNIVDNFKLLVGEINNNVRPLVENVVRILGELWQEHGDELKALFFDILGVINGIINFLRKAWAKWGDDITHFLQIDISIIKNILSAFISVAIGLIRTLIALINGDFAGAWDIAFQAAKQAFENIKRAFRDLLTLASEIVDKIRSKISEAFDITKRNSPSISDRLSILSDAVNSTMQSFEIPDISSKLATELAFGGQNKSFNQNISFGDVQIRNQQDINSLGRQFAFRTNTNPNFKNF